MSGNECLTTATLTRGKKKQQQTIYIIDGCGQSINSFYYQPLFTVPCHYLESSKNIRDLLISAQNE